MPKVYRGMFGDEGQPITGSDKNMLGVRLPPSEPPDMSPDVDGYVAPGTGGLSVSSAISQLPVPLIPKRYRNLDKKYKKARGDDPLEVFRLGDLEFTQCQVSGDLSLVPDSFGHGTIQPTQRILAQDFQTALADTRNQWILLQIPDGT